MKKKGFTLVELMLVTFILALIMSLIVWVLQAGTRNLRSISAGSSLLTQIGNVSRLKTSLYETKKEYIDVTEVPSNPLSRVWLWSTARDDAGIFHYTADYEPDWRGIVVVCPYLVKDEDGAPITIQLRQYKYLSTNHPFSIEDITSTKIKIKDNTAKSYHIRRETGEADVWVPPIGSLTSYYNSGPPYYAASDTPLYRVICSDYKDAHLDKDDTPCCLYISASWDIRAIRGRDLADTELIRSDTIYIQPRN